ncbi:UNVERIFIED_CONTAM: hypothetical protein Sradi_6878800 [Sesamum radiatum]|uniref:Uncharacterized protein n=1 Tax=Sesamum radiatum TaxID=300843 RepID=A0AAW2JJW9_SESRA
MANGNESPSVYGADTHERMNIGRRDVRETPGAHPGKVCSLGYAESTTAYPTWISAGGWPTIG